MNQNPPAASHKDGVWDRQIRSARAILSSLHSIHEKLLVRESLLTLVAEIEGILNWQPFTVEIISNPKSDLFLTPSNILKMKSQAVMPPPGDFSRTDLYCRKRWRGAQHIANEFWSSWRKDYLQSLQSRTKMAKWKKKFQYWWYCFGIARWTCSQSVAHSNGDSSI